MLRKVIATAILGICTFSTLQADDLSELKEILKKQQEQIEKLQEKVESQQAVHNEVITHYIKNEVDRAIQARGTSLLSLGGDHIENLKIKGDLRLRFQRQEFDSEQTSRDRFRLRFRLGFVWKTNEGWEIGAGIATGSNGDNSGRSANQTLNSGGSAFESNDLNLDYAYAKHTWKHNGHNSTLTLGQMKNPFITTGAFWDGDLRPTGIAYQFETTGEGVHYFVTAGAFTVAHLNSGRGNNDVTMYSLQTGVKSDSYVFALAVHNISDDFNEVKNQQNVSSNADLENQYQIADIYLKYMFKAAGIKWAAYGQLAYNFGAKGEEIDSDISGKDDQSYVLGLQAKYNKFKFIYEYRHMEVNGQPRSFTDGSFMGGDGNAEGHVFKVGYEVTNHMSLGLNYYIAEEISPSGDTNEQDKVMQAEVIYKF